MNERSQTTAKDCGEMRALEIEQAVPPPRPSPMPTQVIEFWTPRLMVLALWYGIGRGLRRASRGATFSAADSHEPQ